MRIGVISDTHGLLRPQALAALAGAEHILHAGDIGNVRILEALRTIAPVTAIRGNTDTSGPCSTLPDTEFVDLAGSSFYLIHDRNDLDLNPRAAHIACVVSGHSHRSSIETRDGVLFLNPGSAGPLRFRLPITIAMVEADAGTLTAKIIPMELN